jgi:hypothetical protein
MLCSWKYALVRHMILTSQGPADFVRLPVKTRFALCHVAHR